MKRNETIFDQFEFSR